MGGGCCNDAELCTAVQLLFKSMQAALDDAWNHVQSSRNSTEPIRRTDELFQSNDSYSCLIYEVGGGLVAADAEETNRAIV